MLIKKKRNRKKTQRTLVGYIIKFLWPTCKGLQLFT